MVTAAGGNTARVATEQISHQSSLLKKQTNAAARKGHSSPSSLGVKMWWTPDRGFADSTEVLEKKNFPAEDGSRRVGWQPLQTDWRATGVSAFLEGNKYNELTTETNADPKKTPLIKTIGTKPLKHSPQHYTTSADPSNHQTLLPGTRTTNAHKSQTTLQRTNVQPMKATAFYGSGNSSESSQANSTLTTFIPQNKPGISSITIISRKVSRSNSLPGFNSTSKSPSPPLDRKPMEPNSPQVTVQKKATIVKVTEKRVLSNPGSSASQPRMPPASHGLDAVVRRRKATIIKVTEHRERYSPAKLATRNLEYRHSYTEGLSQDNLRTWNQKNVSEGNTALPYLRLNSAPNSNTFTPNAKTYGIHRSSMNLFVSNPPAAPPSSSEVSAKVVRPRSSRLQRPVSCFGGLIGHTEASRDTAAHSAARKWSLELPQETHINPVNFNSGFISLEKAAKEAGQPVADTLNPGRDEKERRLPSVDGMRRASPSLTLIKTPDPHQSQEEVLALNAAAIIANIKLQRQLSKKKTQSSSAERDSAASPRGTTVTDERKYTSSEQSCQKQPDADPERSPGTVSLQRALQLSRPDFISRSQSRVRALEQRMQERRHRGSGDGQPGATLRQRKAHSTKSTSVNGNLSKPGGRRVAT
ncbi:(E2-independent) E3 ubiquitin-conjugating enzyme FATS, partial [Nematolebias whitei]|uniref:(E2-independent) E3 ubiquitin-conjugating enzyme FATS n=1 Tax=Nematolebias whitei TaxID=451745 RepID=UPI00189BCABF